MDILLTHGYFLYEDPKERAIMRPHPPLGLLYLSAHLKAKGFSVGVFDSTFSAKAAMRDYLLRERPTVVGLYANLMTRRNILEAIAWCRLAGSTVILGGPEPVNYPEQYLAHGADLIVAGEGERTLEELLPHLARHGRGGLERIAGLIYRNQDGLIIRTAEREKIKDLDAQPFPDRAAVALAEYLKVWRAHHGAGVVSLITARGCPYTCTWCSHSVYGYSHRQRSPQNVADELELIREAYNPEGLWYADDVFGINPRWLGEFSAEIKRRGLRLPFEAIAREDRLNEGVIATLRDMGCFRLWIGAESGSQRVLDAMQRRTSATRTREMIRLLRGCGIESGTFIMLGFEGEGWRDIDETVAHLKEAGPDRVLVTLSYPIKGTPYYNQVSGRVEALKPWDEGSGRDLTILGRHSRRFYGHVTRWMLNEVEFHRQWVSRRPDLSRLVASYLHSRWGRFGMYLTRREVEYGQRR